MGKVDPTGISVPEQFASQEPSTIPGDFMAHPTTAHPTDSTESCRGGMWQNITELHGFSLLHLIHPHWHAEHKPVEMLCAHVLG